MRFALGIVVLAVGLLGPVLALRAQTLETPTLGPSIAALVRSGQYDVARARLAHALGDQTDAGLHQGQLEGMIAVVQGQNDKAIVVFRAILSMRPDFLPARIALADVLAREGSFDAALYHYELIALSGDTPTRAMASARISALKAARPYGISGYVSVAPSTNANRGSGHDSFDLGPYQFTIDPDSRATSGIGLGAGGESYYDMRLGPNQSVRASVSGHMVKYLENDAFDTLQLEGSVTLEQQAGLANVSIGPTLSGHWSGWDYALTRYGINGSGQAPLGPNNLVALSFSALRQDYAVSDYRDGYRLEARARLVHQFDPAQKIEFSLGAGGEATQRPHLDHTDFSAGIALASEWAGGLLTEVSGGYVGRKFAGPYPGLNVARKDNRWTFGATLSHRDLEVAGFAPQITYSYTRQFSNVSFFDYDSHDVDLSFTREF